MNSIGPSYRRLAAIGILFLLAYLATVLIAQPIVQKLLERNEQINEMELQATRLMEIEKRLSLTQPIFESEVSRGDGKGLLLVADNEDLASANLQSRLRSLVTTSGATLRSIRSLPTVIEPDEARSIAAKLSIIGDLESVQETIYRIETAVPQLFVDQVSMKPSRRQGEGQQISLDVELDLTAYRAEGDAG